MMARTMAELQVDSGLAGKEAGGIRGPGRGVGGREEGSSDVGGAVRDGRIWPLDGFLRGMENRRVPAVESLRQRRFDSTSGYATPFFPDPKGVTPRNG